MVALSMRKFEDVMELVKTYMFDDVFSSDFIYFCDKDVAEYVSRKAAESLLRGNKLYGDRWEKEITAEIKHKFLNLLYACEKYGYDIANVCGSNAEDIMRKAAINLIELKNAGVREISIFTTKIKGCFESYVIMDFIEDDEDIRLGTGESIEADVENIYPDEMVYLKEKRAYRRN